MKIKIDNRLEWFLSPIKIESIRIYDRSKRNKPSDVDRASLYSTSMILRQLGHE